MSRSLSLGYPKNFFIANEILQKITPLWYPGKETPFVWRSLYYVYLISLYFIAITYYVCEVLIIKETSTSIHLLVRQVGMFFTHSVGLLKFYFLLSRRSQIELVQGILQDEKYCYEPFEEFNPGEVMTKEKEKNSHLCVVIFILYSFVGFSAHITTAVILTTDVEGTYFADNTTCYDFLPYYFTIPFPSETKWQCHIAVTYMDIAFAMFAWAIACADVLFMALVNCLKANLIIITNSLRSIRTRCLTRLHLPQNYYVFDDNEFPEIENEMYQQLSFSIQHLQAMLSVRDEIESLFTNVILVQTMASLLIFASCLFVASAVPLTSPEFIAQMEFFMAVLIQLFVFCWFGNEMTIACSTISTDLYECDWYSSSNRFKTSLLFVMMRMQRPVYVSIGKFSPLNLRTFLAVVKGSFSYFAVFKSIQ